MCTLRGEISLAQLRGDRLGLRDLLRLQALALEHVHEVHVAADVELVGPVDGDAAVLEQLREHAVRDGRADLALDVVADDRDAGVLELLRPLRGAGDEDGQRVDERDLGVDGALGVELRGLLRADGQVADEDVDLGLAQGGDDVDRLLVGLGDHLAVVLAEAVEVWPRCTVTPVGGTSQILIVLFSLAPIASARSRPTFLRVDVERGDELDVADVVVAELHVHQAGDLGGRVGVLVVLDALDQRRRTVADADDRYANRTHRDSSLKHRGRTAGCRPRTWCAAAAPTGRPCRAGGARARWR